MTFISMPLGDAVQKEVLPEGEYELVIEDVKIKEKDNKERISVRCSVDGEPNARAVFHNIWFPDPDADEEKQNNTLLFAIAFCDAFDIPWKSNGFNLEDFFGSRGRVYLTQDEYEGVPNNNIRLRI